jgi:uncharacterized protein YhaN
MEQAQSAHKDSQGQQHRWREMDARQRDIAEKLQIISRQKAQMIDHFKVSSLREVDKKLRDLEKRQVLQDQIIKTERDILDAMDVNTIEEAEQRLVELDRSTLETEMMTLKTRLVDQDKRVRTLFNEQCKAADRIEAIGGDEAVALIEEQRQTLMLEIQEGAEHYLRLKLGVAATEQALRLYRDQHRSAMIRHASEAFQLISCGAYTGLATQPDKDNDVLVVIGADKSSKAASELSKGTRFQLYLALRLAGYREFAQTRSPVPFIADDIMETFDDARAEEAFKLLMKMAKVGQVIYLTHHQHLCDIVRKLHPEVKVHQLPFSK